MNERREREKCLVAGGPMPFVEQHEDQPDTIWRCPVCGFLTAEEGSSSCPRCLGEIGDDEGDLWQPYVPV